jgi:hypothetical protein
MLYRYVFRGFGVLFVLGMLTALILAIVSAHRAATRPPLPRAGHSKVAL